jgi:NAD(P)-dependent dehydrogenase (short-subunit alcohol dehydrogenase family)
VTPKKSGDRKGTVVVTGGSAGVGRAAARAFAERGFDVAVLARGRAGLDAAVRELEAAGASAMGLEADVSQHAEVERAAAQAEARLGPIEVWVNNAMTTVFAPLSETTPEDFERAVGVTFLGQVWGTMAALTRMRPRDRGSIVNVGSALAFIGIPLQAAYCSSKFAARGFFESVRSELVHEGSHVKLSMVHLPAVNTPQFDWCATTLPCHPQPVPPIYQPEVPARHIVEVALDGRRTKVVGAWNKLLVAAGTLLPSVADQYAAREAWEPQMTADRVSPDRPCNLYEPADTEVDAAAHGSFDADAKGLWNPDFLRTLPSATRDFTRAARAAASEWAIAMKARLSQGV